MMTCHGPRAYQATLILSSMGNDFSVALTRRTLWLMPQYCVHRAILRRKRSLPHQNPVKSPHCLSRVPGNPVEKQAGFARHVDHDVPLVRIADRFRSPLSGPAFRGVAVREHTAMRQFDYADPLGVQIQLVVSSFGQFTASASRKARWLAAAAQPHAGCSEV